MTKQSITKILATLVLIFFTFLSVSCTGNNAPVAPPAGITSKVIQWEYKTLTIDDRVGGAFYNENAKIEPAGQTGSLIEDSANPVLQGRLDKLGQEGWELVGFSGGANDISTVMVFKRIKQ